MPVEVKKKTKTSAKKNVAAGGSGGGNSDEVLAVDNSKSKIATSESKSYEVGIPTGGVVEDIKTAVASVLVKHKDGSAEVSNGPVAVTQGQGPLANVGIRLSRKINLGNYESAEVQISFHAPCQLEQDDIEETFAFAVNWVDNKMDELVGKYSGGAGDAGQGK